MILIILLIFIEEILTASVARAVNFNIR